jgi:hypothetical protein
LDTEPKKNLQEKMAISINRILNSSIACILIVYTAQAQKIAIKPLIGYSYNGVTQTSKASPSFTEGALLVPKPNWGILISYPIAPSYDIEVGLVNRSMGVSYNTVNPNTNEKLFNSYTYVACRFYQINVTKGIKTYSPHLSLNTIAGFEFVQKGVKRGGSFNNLVPDTLILPNYESGILSGLNFNRDTYWTYGINLGIGVIWNVKQRNLAELRFCVGYQFQPLVGRYAAATVNGVTQREEYRATQLNCNLSLMINMVQLLGLKLKD